MECSIKAQKVQAMKKYKRAQLLYNVVLYSLTSLITCFFFAYQFPFPSIKHLLVSLPNINIKINSFPLDAKCLFIVANIIIFILIGESKLLRSSNSSPVSDIYDEYIARSRSCPKINNSYVVAKVIKKEDECKKIMKFEEKKKVGNIKKACDEEKNKRELKACNSMQHIHKEKKNGLKVSKSEVWGESEIMQFSEKTKGGKEKKNGLRVSKSEVWGENEIMQLSEKIKGGKEEHVYVPKEELNKRVEAFIARVNKQRLLEATLVDHDSRG